MLAPIGNLPAIPFVGHNKNNPLLHFLRPTEDLLQFIAFGTICLAYYNPVGNT